FYILSLLSVTSFVMHTNSSLYSPPFPCFQANKPNLHEKTKNYWQNIHYPAHIVSYKHKPYIGTTCLRVVLSPPGIYSGELSHW
ncbi:MAG: hypothetical protein B6D61_09770, partial [Bacteroidetes bacterium 4484_249]